MTTVNAVGSRGPSTVPATEPGVRSFCIAIVASLAVGGVLPSLAAAAEEYWIVEGPDSSNFSLEASGNVENEQGATLRFQSHQGAQGLMGGTSLSLDATPFRRRRLVIKAEVRAEGSAITSSLWVRVTGANGVDFFDNGFGAPIRAVDWEPRSVTVPIGSESRTISFGLTQRGLGATDARRLRIEPAPMAATSPAAEELLHAAIGEVRAQAYYASRVDWEATTAELLEINRGATSTDEVYPVVAYLLRKLGDQHSFVQKPTAARAYAAQGNSKLSHSRTATHWPSCTGRRAVIFRDGSEGCRDFRDVWIVRDYAGRSGSEMRVDRRFARRPRRKYVATGSCAPSTARQRTIWIFHRLERCARSLGNRGQATPARDAAPEGYRFVIERTDRELRRGRCGCVLRPPEC